MSIIVNVETQAGKFIATARQGTSDYIATSPSPDMAAKLAGARRLGVFIADVQAEEKAPGVWSITPRHGALVQEAAP